MWAFLLSPLGRKIALGVVILVAGGALLRWYGNRQYEEGQDSAKVKMADELKKAADTARDKVLSETKAERESLVEQQRALQARVADLIRNETRLQATLEGRLSSIDARLRRETIEVSTIPVSDLPDGIRAANRIYRARRGSAPGPGAPQ